MSDTFPTQINFQNTVTCVRAKHMEAFEPHILQVDFVQKEGQLCQQRCFQRAVRANSSEQYVLDNNDQVKNPQSRALKE